MRSKPRKSDAQVVGFLGVGLDDDGHRRVTTCDHFLLVGGSAETHEHMQETAIKFGEALERQCRRLEDVPPDEVAKLLRQVRRADGPARD